MTTVTVRAVDDTPPALRHLDGRTFQLNATTPWPAEGVHATLFGIPGVLVAEAGELVWQITADPIPPRDPGPPWAQALHADVREVKALLAELRDNLSLEGALAQVDFGAIVQRVRDAQAAEAQAGGQQS